MLGCRFRRSSYTFRNEKMVGMSKRDTMMMRTSLGRRNSGLQLGIVGRGYVVKVNDPNKTGTPAAHHHNYLTDSTITSHLRRTEQNKGTRCYVVQPGIYYMANIHSSLRVHISVPKTIGEARLRQTISCLQPYTKAIS